MLPFIDSHTENIFFAVLKELKEKINSLANKNHVIGQYWGQTDIRAPFEEELTLSQLASLDPHTLLKKKSFNQEKVLALVKAVRTALERGRLSLVKQADTHLNKYTVSDLAENIIKITSADKDLTTNDLFLILGVFSAVTLLSSKHDFVGLFDRLLEQLGYKTFIELFCTKNIKKDNKNHLIKIDQCLAEHLPEVHLHWRTALSGAGASLHTLLSPYVPAIFNDHQNKLIIPICKTLMRGMNSTEVKISKVTLSDHFTLNPEVAQKLYKALKPKRDFTSVADTAEHLAAAMPFFDFQSIYTALSKNSVT